ncbi:hypothetical protein GZL_04632 [Streptomyces sp. 769]|nr:hypothetical protein GZL_04632 [Streptomyces sp. 769]
MDRFRLDRGARGGGLGPLDGSGGGGGGGGGAGLLSRIPPRLRTLSRHPLRLRLGLPLGGGAHRPYRVDGTAGYPLPFGVFARLVTVAP